MWPLFLLIVIPFLLLALIEEVIEFLVNRYALGPAAWEGKVKVFFQSKYRWIRKKFMKAPLP